MFGKGSIAIHVIIFVYFKTYYNRIINRIQVITDSTQKFECFPN